MEALLFMQFECVCISISLNTHKFGHCVACENSEVGRLFSQATILDSIKWNNYPPSPQSNDEGAKEQKTRHFVIIEMGEGVVQMFHLICPKL